MSASIPASAANFFRSDMRRNSSRKSLAASSVVSARSVAGTGRSTRSPPRSTFAWQARRSPAARRSGLRRVRSACVSPESRVAPSSTTTAHVSHSPRPSHSAGRRTPRRLAASQMYVPSATTPPRLSSPTFHSTLTLIRLLNTKHFQIVIFGKTLEKYINQKAKGKRQQAKGKKKSPRAARLHFCPLPFEVCLLPLLGVGRGGEADARLGGGLFRIHVLAALALRADAEDAKAVLRRLEPVPGDDCVLNGLQLGGVEFDCSAALGADHVVVVRVFVVVLVARAPVAEAHLAGESRLDQELEGTIDGGVADVRLFRLDEPVEVFARKVLLGAQEHVEDEVALRRPLQPGALYVLVENLFLFGHGPPPLTPACRPARCRLQAAILTHAGPARREEF